MAFNANVIVLRTGFTVTPGTEQFVRMENAVVHALSGVLNRFGICVGTTLLHSEYEANTTSKEINRYIRIKDTGELVKYESGTYRNEVFASAQYGFFSISVMGDFVVIWCSFHSRLGTVFESFHDTVSMNLARVLSQVLRCEAMVLQASSFSRQSDLFVLYINGVERNTLGGKGALTDVKNTYGVDINRVMDNVDQNMAIFYAPIDYAQIKGDMQRQKERHAVFMERTAGITINDQETGENMVKAFEQENKEVVAQLEDCYRAVELALQSEPIGNAVFFKMEYLPRGTSVDNQERQFGG